MEWFDELLIPYASGAGLPVDQFKFVIFILLSYPLGFLHLNILFRHLFATIIGFTFLVLSFGFVGIFHFLMSSFLVYGLVLLLGHSKAPTIGFVVMMGYLSYLHISRLLVDYMGWKMDVTAVVMVSTIKITSLCCNYADGYLADNLVSKNAKPFAIKQWPSILEYLSFLCYFPTFLAGPAFSYKSYLSYIDGTMYGKEKPSTASEAFAALKVMLVAFGCVGTHLFLGGVYSMDAFFVENSPLDGTSLLYKIYYLHLALMVKRCQYYFVWKLSEGAAILAGMGFNGYETDKKTGVRSAKFDGCCNIDILKCELPQNVRDYTTYWNMKTAEWLRIYVYDRMQDPKSNAPSGYAMLVTNTTSAFWHGFYPGYYLAFGYASFIIEEMRMCRSTIRPYFMKPRKLDADGKPLPEEGNFPLKYLYDIFGTLCTFLTFDAGMGFFTALSMANSWTYMNRVYWIQLILSAIAYPILIFLSARDRPPKKVDDKAKTETDKTKKDA